MTSNDKHKKHGDLSKPALGQYGRREWAFYGTDCASVEAAVQGLRLSLPDVSLAYVDADHAAAEESFEGISLEWKGSASRITLPSTESEFIRRMRLIDAQLIVVNGNHFPAATQIVVVDERKKESLRKRLDQIQNPVAVICADDQLPEWFTEMIPAASNLPRFRSVDHADFIVFVRSRFLKPAPLKALLMTGGKSVRMGRDKSLISYHDQAQYLFMKEMLESAGLETWISCRNEQADFFTDNGCRVITDRVTGIGPLGGIISAFMNEPETAWLVLASDLPLIDRSVIDELLDARSTAHLATAFRSPHDRFPEPLIAIWEPAIYPFILQFLAQGVSCPRKVLIQTSAQIIDAMHPEKLENVNTPDEMQDVMEQLKFSGTKN